VLFAKDHSRALLKAMLDYEIQDQDAHEFSRIMFRLKLWLDETSPEISAEIQKIESKGKKPWESLGGPAGLLRDSVVAMQKLIGINASFMDQMSASSVDNMIDLAISDTSGLSGLGHAFVDLNAKLTAWNKASTTEATEEINNLVAEAECLARAAKLCLACQSGSLSAFFSLSSSRLWTLHTQLKKI
jgi:hypothetical protein